MKIKLITKRNGEIVDFSLNKIQNAVEKAFIKVTRESHSVLAKHISEMVLSELELIAMNKDGDYIPKVEDVQDIVEKNIMKAGFFDVAKEYIIYRYSHNKIREEKQKEVIEEIEENSFKIKNRNGTEEYFSSKKLLKFLNRFAGKFKNIDCEKIVNQVKLEMYEGMSTADLSRLIISVVRAMIEIDPDYSKFATQLLLVNIYRELLGKKIDHDTLEDELRSKFMENIQTGISLGYYDKRLMDFDLKKLSESIDYRRNDMFDYLGSQTLQERYLVRDTNGGGNILEEIQSFWMRVAMGLALNEKDDVRGYEDGVKIDKNNIRTEKAIEFYNVMSKHLFVPSSPTLFHAGTNHPQLSSCYLNDVGDSLESIFKVYADNAQLSRWAGGIGTSWSMLRANGSLVKKTGIKSNGIVPFLKIANDVTVAINRSGRRRGATVAYLDNWHADIEEFLDLRKNTGDDRRRTHDMNTALWISDLFMKRVKSDGDWFLFSPDETPTLLETYGKKFEEEYLKFEQQAKLGQIKIFKQYKAKDIWKKMITSLYETGHPWITFKDPSNIRSPQDHVGIVRHSNLCTEITLNSSLEETAVCNLGSINYETHIINGKFDKDLISSTVSTAMRMLDNVIDINFYPTKEAEYSNMRHRPVGLGVMGFHDALYKLDISFDSEEAVKFSDESMEIISYYAILGSSLLAKEKGVYETYKGSKWDRNILPIDTIEMLEKERGEAINVNKSATMDWTTLREHIKNFGMRNSNCMAIAPTATISNIIGSVPCIEPIYKNIYVKSNLNGEFIIVNPYLVKDLKDRNLWDYEMLGQLKYNDGSIKNIPSIPHELKNKYKEVFEIDARHLVKVAAYRQKWIDQAQSFNLFYSGTSGKELSDIYIYAWEMGLKTTYYLRTLGASQVEKSTVNTSEFGSTHKRQVPTTQESVEIKSEIVDTPKSSVVYNIKKAPEATCDGCQ